MFTAEMMEAILSSLVDPFVFVDCNHTILYMNKAADKFFAKSGGFALIGKSIFDCHNKGSQKAIQSILERLKNGKEEMCIAKNRRGKNMYMRGVWNKEGELIGYYERYENVPKE